jgi:hypothetical protein
MSGCVSPVLDECVCRMRGVSALPCIQVSQPPTHRHPNTPTRHPNTPIRWDPGSCRAHADGDVLGVDGRHDGGGGCVGAGVSRLLLACYWCLSIVRRCSRHVSRVAYHFCFCLCLCVRVRACVLGCLLVRVRACASLLACVRAYMLTD